MFFIDKRVNVIIKNYLNVEVERLTNNIVSQVIRDSVISENIDSFLIFDGDRTTYDTLKINKFKSVLHKKLSDALINLDDGYIDDYFIPNRVKTGRFKNIKNGILCDISLGSLRNSVLFSNIGPTIPIKLLFSSQINSDIDVDIEEYGINNVIVKIYYVVSIKEQVIMPLSSKRKTIKIREPISIDIIKGSIPNYYIPHS